MKFRFTAENFNIGPVPHGMDQVIRVADAVALANIALKAEEAKCMPVFARGGDLNFWHGGPDDGELCGEETHTALLWNIEEIQK